MKKEYFTDNLSVETLAKFTDKMLNYEKNKKAKSIKIYLLKTVSAVAVIAFVIGAVNMLPAFLNNTEVSSGTEAGINAASATETAVTTENDTGYVIALNNTVQENEYYTVSEEADNTIITIYDFGKITMPYPNDGVKSGVDNGYTWIQLTANSTFEFTNGTADGKTAEIPKDTKIEFRGHGSNFGLIGFDAYGDFNTNSLTSKILLFKSPNGDGTGLNGVWNLLSQFPNGSRNITIDPSNTMEAMAEGNNILYNPIYVDGGLGFSDAENAPSILDYSNADGVTDSKYCSNQTPYFVQWKYDKAYTVNRMLLRTANDSDIYMRRPADGWTLSGSNDGQTWTVIYTGKEDDIGNTAFTYYSIDLSGNMTAYQYYQLYADSPADKDLKIIQLADVILCGTAAGINEANSDENLNTENCYTLVGDGSILCNGTKIPFYNQKVDQEIYTSSMWSILDPENNFTIQCTNGVTIKAPAGTAVGYGNKIGYTINIGNSDATITKPDGTSSKVPAKTVLDGEGNIIK